LTSEFTAVDCSVHKPFPDIPYVFLNGKPACAEAGLSQLADGQEFKGALTPHKLSLNERIEALLNSKDVLLFMKGSPENPQCGFSGKIVNILKSYDGLQYGHFNIFEDNEIREGLKKYSDWPTFPQLYYKSKLVGGIDIV
jgi:Grx4 family monothiol glutaredoxin